MAIFSELGKVDLGPFGKKLFIYDPATLTIACIFCRQKRTANLLIALSLMLDLLEIAARVYFDSKSYSTNVVYLSGKIGLFYLFS